ncbi:MAG: dihydropteroate synthase [Nitrospirae bacterium]|nr:MAG: dihydropteroate synthase [Nitrospirota bacterium]
MKLSWKQFELNFTKKTCVMGIINTTPDSFSEGGADLEPSRAVEHALRMVEEGADILDIGGESSRPGSDPVTAEEEIRRTMPVIEALAKKTVVPLSIDTCKAAVARRALDAGASIINDISGLRSDPGMMELAASAGVPVVIMHMKGTPKSMQVNPVYEDLIAEILAYFRDSIRLATRAGISEEMIILDPGIGFGKTFDHNLRIINRLDAFRQLGRPILVGPSRKAFIGKILGNAPPAQRLEGTAAVVAASILRGADIIRVHDVREMAKVARVADAIKQERVPE